MARRMSRFVLSTPVHSPAQVFPPFPGSLARLPLRPSLPLQIEGNAQSRRHPDIVARLALLMARQVDPRSGRGKPSYARQKALVSVSEKRITPLASIVEQVGIKSEDTVYFLGPRVCDGQDKDPSSAERSTLKVFHNSNPYPFRQPYSRLIYSQPLRRQNRSPIQGI